MFVNYHKVVLLFLILVTVFSRPVAFGIDRAKTPMEKGGGVTGTGGGQNNGENPGFLPFDSVESLLDMNRQEKEQIILSAIQFLKEILDKNSQRVLEVYSAAKSQLGLLSQKDTDNKVESFLKIDQYIRGLFDRFKIVQSSEFSRENLDVYTLYIILLEKHDPLCRSGSLLAKVNLEPQNFDQNRTVNFCPQAFRIKPGIEKGKAFGQLLLHEMMHVLGRKTGAQPHHLLSVDDLECEAQSFMTSYMGRAHEPLYFTEYLKECGLIDDKGNLITDGL